MIWGVASPESERGGVHLILSNENAPSGGYSTKAKNIMAKMGYKEGKGLGHQEQGRIEPISLFVCLFVSRQGFSV